MEVWIILAPPEWKPTGVFDTPPRGIAMYRECVDAKKVEAARTVALFNGWQMENYLGLWAVCAPPDKRVRPGVAFIAETYNADEMN